MISSLSLSLKDKGWPSSFEPREVTELRHDLEIDGLENGKLEQSSKVVVNSEKVDSGDEDNGESDEQSAVLYL